MKGETQMKIRNVIWGLFFIFAAIMVVTNQIGLFTHINFIGLLIVVLLIPVIIESCIHLNFPGIFFPTGFILLVFDKPLGLGDLSFWTVMLASLFLSIGFSIIFKPKYNWNNQFKHVSNNENNTNFSTDPNSEYYQKNYNENKKVEVDYTNENNIKFNVDFSASSKYIHSNALESVTIHCSFGHMKVYFDNAQLSPNGASIHLDCSFGGVQLYIPRAWHVVNSASVSLGAIDEKNGHSSNVGPIVKITGNVSLGGAEIYYI